MDHQIQFPIQMNPKRKASPTSIPLPPNGTATAEDDHDHAAVSDGLEPATYATETAAIRDGNHGSQRKCENVGNEGDGVEEVDDDDDVEADEEQDQEEEEEEAEAEAAAEAEDEPPKLDEGFFEIESIRRKRVRKGQLQYLIKWRGWPETSNTWEPLEHLQSCSDVIDAFEESLLSGKSSRERKRKWGVSNSHNKKKQPRTSSWNNVTGDDDRRSLPSTSLNTSSLASLPAYTQEEDNNIYDPKLRELRGSRPSNNADADRVSVQLDAKSPAVENGLLKVDSVDTAQNNRQKDAKRRKSASVKRFRKDQASCDPTDTSLSKFSLSGGTSAQLKTETFSLTGCGSDYKVESPIIKILKPVSFSNSSSDNIQDVIVTFVALRSDGKEVVVDNKFLKAHDPLLLINFYEKHLKYSA